MLCQKFPSLRPVEVARMPWHERWFYIDWIQDEVAEQNEGLPGGEFADPRKPMTGDLATFDFAALGADHKVI